MKSTYQSIILSVLFLCVGLLVGWTLWGRPVESENMSDMNGGDMYSMMAHMDKSLEGKTGDDFDIVFLNQMIVHHQGAVDMANSAIKNAKHQEIIDLSKNILDAQTREINQMKSWLKSWYNL